MVKDEDPISGQEAERGVGVESPNLESRVT